ncbi:MAG TPA: response regulator [Nitrososphaeraceae archaeon]|jgi:CheY-like chemotaxis protein|nr:response regulator [Nitrososphaeraceae archaeon]
MERSDGLHNSKINVTRMSPLRHCSIGRRQDEYKQIGDDIKKSEVIFSNKSECYCISMIDIVGSTQITSKLYNSGKIKKFYTVFINEIADIVKLHDGKILKTVGDGVIFFFPKTSTVDNIDGFRQALECSLNMVSSRHIINAKLHKEFLPDISYRISADYGKLEVAMSGEISSSYDLFGPTINFCAKINKKAPPNGVAIGADLWRIVNSFPKLAKRYHFQEIKELSWKENKYSYPVYMLKSSKEGYIARKPILVPRNDSMYELESTPKVPTVLLIDDDPSISFLFTQYLRSAGIVVDSFTDPEKALTHFIESDYRHYDLVVTDIRMSQLNGFELYQQLKTLDPNLQIIFVTALDIAQEITTLLPEVKLNQFLIKPVNPNVLINSVKQHANKHIEGALS